MSSRKYASLGDDAPEVVPNQDAPELVKYDTHTQSFAEARRSNDQPETLHVAAYDKQAYEYYGSRNESGAPAYSSWGAGRGPDEDVMAHKTEQDQRRDRHRRICGMKRGILIAVFVVVTLVIIGAVVGGVLGAILPGQSSSTTAIQASSMTGLATTVQDGTLYQYFLLPDGNVVENNYTNNEWSLKDGSIAQDAIVTSDAAGGTPLAAIAYPYSGQNYRQIFYLNSAGIVRTMNRTSTGSWSAPVSISQVAAEPGSNALAACWSNSDLDGLRIYYASQYGFIQEIGGYLNGSAWTEYFSFPDSDPHAGVACSVTKDSANEYINVYYRDPRNGTVTQSYWDFAPGKGGWYIGAVSGPGHIMMPGSDIAVTSDAVQTEYVFYQAPNNMITLGINDPTQTVYETFTQRQPATAKSKFSAAYFQNGAVVMFQNSSSSSTIWASDVSRDGVEIFNMAVA